MTKSDTMVVELELRNIFSEFKSVQKSDLRNFYAHHSESAAEQGFRRFLYGLEKQNIITPIGTGIYAFHDKTSLSVANKNHFSPSWSQELVT